MDEMEERLYFRVIDELATRTYRQELFAQAVAETDGNDQRAVARYLSLRLKELRESQRPAPVPSGDVATREAICPICAQYNAAAFPAGAKSTEITCTRCNTRYFYCN